MVTRDNIEDAARDIIDLFTDIQVKEKEWREILDQNLGKNTEAYLNIEDQLMNDLWGDRLFHGIVEILVDLYQNG